MCVSKNSACMKCGQQMTKISTRSKSKLPFRLLRIPKNSWPTKIAGAEHLQNCLAPDTFTMKMINTRLVHSYI